MLLTQDSNWSNVVGKLGLPLIVKPSHEGSTFGLTKVTDIQQLPDAYALAAKYDDAVIAEQFIDGIEITCGILGRNGDARALPLIQLVPQDAIYDYQQKYFTNDTKYFCPAAISPELTSTIQKLVLDSYSLLGCRGWGRADLMIRASDNKPFLLEMNTSPGMTSHSLVPMAARAAGIDYATLCLEILQLADLDIKHKA
jgi:D-alanine-D-alanine ligase